MRITIAGYDACRFRIWIVAWFLTLCACGPVLTMVRAQPTAPSDKEQYAIVLKPVPRLVRAENWTDKDNEAVAAHFKRLKDLTVEGTVVHAGRTINEGPTQFGIVIVEVVDESQARQIMEGDPAVMADVMTARLFPYRTALMRTAKAGKK